MQVFFKKKYILIPFHVFVLEKKKKDIYTTSAL